MTSFSWATTQIRLGPAEGPGVKASRTVREKSRGYIEGAVYKSSARILFLYDSLECERLFHQWRYQGTMTGSGCYRSCCQNPLGRLYPT